MIFPKNFNLNPSILQKEYKKIKKNLLFDFDKNEFCLKDGDIKKVEGKKSIEIWIEKILRTKKDRYKIYENKDYGMKIEDLLVGHNYTQSFVESEIKREITKALKKHPKIQSLSNFKITKDNPYLNIDFVVNLKDESFKKEVQIAYE